MINSLKGIINYYRKSHVTKDKCYQQFKSRIDVMDDIRGDILGKLPCLLESNEKTNYAQETEKERNEYKKCIKKEMIAALMLHGADRTRYQRLKNTLAQNYSMGTNNISKMIDEVIYILSSYKKTA